MSREIQQLEKGTEAMDEKSQDNRLHLPSLSITGFRGIDALTIERLGRVTLLAGKNSVGKTTVLDAVRLYAARGHHVVLSNILESHEEVAAFTDGRGGQGFGPCWETIFHGRDASQGAHLAIGANGNLNFLSIAAVFPREVPDTMQFHSWKLPIRILRFVFGEQELGEDFIFSPYALSTRITRSRRVYQVSGPSLVNLPDEIPCQSMGPGLLSNDAIMERWDAIALTDDEDRVVNALQPILGEQVSRIAIIGNEGYGSRVLAKLQGQGFPVPLKSFGDGAQRLFGVALALVNSRDGFLLIDEAENGIHHSVQPDLWRMVLLAAHANNVQVIATTHSYDCVRGFAEAMADCEGIEGALVRLEREEGRLRAVEYSERNLKAIARQPPAVEVR